MSKHITSKITLIFLALTLTACTSTLQEDIFDSTEASSQVLTAVADFEKSFIKYDADYIINSKITYNDTVSFHSTLEAKLSETHEPAIISQLQALNGLVYLMENKAKKAQDCYKSAKENQQDNTYIILLQSRLNKDINESLKAIEQVTASEPENEVFLLEKGKLLYKLFKYDNSIAAIDNALMISDQKNKSIYREYYSSFRDQVWNLYNSQITSTSKDINLSANLTKDSMLILTTENSSLLNSFTAGTKMSTSELTKKLTAYGAFSSAIDENNKNNSADELIKSSAITRIMAARFLWNLYVEEKAKPELKTRYSKRYQNKGSSPIADVEIDNEDFDAVMGTVEKEIMDLPDGKAFFPYNVLTNLDYVTILKKLEE